MGNQGAPGNGGRWKSHGPPSLPLDIEWTILWWWARKPGEGEDYVAMVHDFYLIENL